MGGYDTPVDGFFVLISHPLGVILRWSLTFSRLLFSPLPRSSTFNLKSPHAVPFLYVRYYFLVLLLTQLNSVLRVLH